MSTPEVFVVSALRTAIGGFGGSLKDVSPIELGTQVSRAALAKSGIAPGHIGHVVMGNVIPTEARDAYLSRVIALEAGLTARNPGHERQPPVRLRPAGHRVGGTIADAGRRSSGAGRWRRIHEPRRVHHAPGPLGRAHG